MSEETRARNVCRACMLRKKACDKALPACGFCASRRLHCSYDVSVQGSKGRRRYNPGKHFVPLGYLSPPTVSSHGTNMAQAIPSTESKWGNLHTGSPSLHISQGSFEVSLNPQGQRLIDFIHSIQDEIIKRYFTGFHTSFPVVSPDTFCQDASRYQQERLPPPADFTVLLLVMLLIISPSLSPSILPPGTSQKFLYVTTKAAFSHAQVSISTSLRLVQAALLIALREYTGTRPEAAYVSLMGCVGMARLLRIATTTIRRTGDPGTTEELQADLLEKKNVAWATAMLERLILCEISQPNLPPQTEYPSPEHLLPADLGPTAGLDYKSNPALEKVHKTTFSNAHLMAEGSFARQASVISLLDQLLTALRHADVDTETKLALIDGKIQRVLTEVLSEPDWKRTVHCVPAAMCVRQLLLLHGSVVDRQRYPQSQSNGEIDDIASLGVRTACRIILDVLECDPDGHGLVMPICCFYSIREARTRMQERSRFSTEKGLAHEIDAFLHAEQEYRRTWAF